MLILALAVILILLTSSAIITEIIRDARYRAYELVAYRASILIIFWIFVVVVIALLSNTRLP